MEIELLHPRDFDDFQLFINEHWRENHIFTKDKVLFDWQHMGESNSHYDFYLAKEDNKITAILGFIDFSKHKDTKFLAIWKSIGLGHGMQLFKKFLKDFKQYNTAAVGISEDAKKIYEIYGYNIFELAHYYFPINPNEDVYSSSQNILQPKNTEFIDIKSLKTEGELTIQKAYIAKRYLSHPSYNYHVYEITDGSTSQILVTRVQKVGESSILRIVDIMVSDNKYLQFDIGRLVQMEGITDSVLYVDIYTTINESLNTALLDSGFIVKTDNDVVPNYFNPFVKKNIKIFGASKLPLVTPVTLGDSDQDRPN